MGIPSVKLESSSAAFRDTKTKTKLGGLKVDLGCKVTAQGLDSGLEGLESFEF